MGLICSTSKIASAVEVEDNHPSVKKKSSSETEKEDENPETLRILLLGAAESGKTTLLSQIRMLHEQSFSESELIHRRAYVYNHIIFSMKAILTFASANDLQLSLDNQQRAKEILSIDECLGPFSKQEFDAIENLWKDPAVQEVYKKRGNFNLNDSAKYFFDNLARINDLHFQPTPSDLIRAYCPTIGIQNIVFTAKNKSFQLFDIGGQKVDRRKWATMYDGIDAIFFCLAISEYDQHFDDGVGESRLTDSLNLLEQICEEPKFESTPIFIFLNEVDVLKEKLERIPLRKYLPDYNGQTESEALVFLQNKVREKCQNHDEELIWMEYTCGIDSEEMATILDIVFKKLLKMSK